MEIGISNKKQALDDIMNWGKYHNSKLFVRITGHMVPTTNNTERILDYGVTFPVNFNNFDKIRQYLVNKEFSVPNVTEHGIAYIDNSLILQSKGMWLSYKEITDSSGRINNQWILRIYINNSSIRGVIMFYDILDQNEIIKKIWPYIGNSSNIPILSENQNLFQEIFSNETGCNIVFNFTRLKYEKDNLLVHLDILQLGKSTYSITGTVICDDYFKFSNIYQDLSNYVDMIPLRSKVKESLYIRRPDMYNELISKTIDDDEEKYDKNHISSILPDGITCDYFH
jgi:hypothetical protein